MTHHCTKVVNTVSAINLIPQKIKTYVLANQLFCLGMMAPSLTAAPNPLATAARNSLTIQIFARVSSTRRAS